jgi:hypothetical protein
VLETTLDQYKLAVEMADRVSARRGLANSFFAGLQSSLVAIEGLADLNHRAVAGAGLVLAIAWWMQLGSFRQLNAAKWQVITKMESQLSASPFADEWAILETRRRSGVPTRYLNLGVVEKVVPVTFGVIFASLLISNL